MSARNHRAGPFDTMPSKTNWLAWTTLGPFPPLAKSQRLTGQRTPQLGRIRLPVGFAATVALAIGSATARHGARPLK
jgi:hypothetical protein